MPNVPDNHDAHDYAERLRVGFRSCGNAAD